MRIDFYDARITDHDRTVLVKEKGINYECQKMDSPKEISLMLKKLLHMDELAEEHVYLIALNNSCKVLGMFFLSGEHCKDSGERSAAQKRSCGGGYRQLPADGKTAGRL